MHDYRKLNAVTKRDAYLMPRIDDILDELGQAKYITTLDLDKGYWQVPVNPQDQEKNSQLKSFTFTIEHKKGKDNVNADTLSRIPEYIIQPLEGGENVTEPESQG